MNGLLLTDGYKTGHHQQYPHGTEHVYSNWTPRSNKYAPKGCDKVVSFGQQFVMKWLHDYFEDNFFSKPKQEVCKEIKEELSMYLGSDYDVSHFEKYATFFNSKGKEFQIMEPFILICLRI